MNEINFPVKKWILTTFRGWLIGIILILMLSAALDAMKIGHMQFYVGVGMSAGVGLMQWLFLKKRIAMRISWLWASVAGMGIPFVIMDLLVEERFKYKLPLSVAFGSLATGALQYMILKNYFSKASSWIAACFIGWMLSALAVLAINYTMELKAAGVSNLLLALLNLLIILSGGILLGIITGKALSVKWKR